MDSSEAKAKVKGVVDKVFEVSKEAIGKAGNAVQKFSDTSVIKIEIRQFESKLKAQKALLGDVVENALENNQTQLDLNTEEITAIANEIARINVRGKGGFVLSAKNCCYFGSKSTQNNAFCVYNIPLSVHVVCVSHISFHCEISLNF